MIDDLPTPNSATLRRWYDAHADGVWGDDKPTWLAFRDHAKCLRLTDDVKNYFKAYRKKKADTQVSDHLTFRGCVSSETHVQAVYVVLAVHLLPE